MEWKSKIEDECCEDELEEMITNYVKAGFWPNDKILMECEEHIKDFYCEEWGNITEDGLRTIIEALREKFQNTGNQENFLKLESVGFPIQWDGTAGTKIAIKDFKWDKYYTDSE